MQLTVTISWTILVAIILLNVEHSLSSDNWLLKFVKHIPIKQQPERWRKSNKCQCGVARSTNPDERIVGGVLTKPYAWPWMGAIVFVGYGTPKILCGASIINSRYLLTAGHCAEYVKTEGIDKFRLYLGTNELSDSEKVVPQLDSVIIHPKFNRTSKFYDAALLKLKDDLEFTSSVSPICLTPQNGAPFINRSAVVIGWGATTYGGSPATMQMQAMVNITSNNDCQQQYSKAEDPVEISSQMMCASSLNADSCQGDSGGPLFLKREKTNTFQQVGIVSFGNGCANEFPGVYARIGKILSWVKSSTKDAIYCKNN